MIKPYRQYIIVIVLMIACSNSFSQLQHSQLKLSELKLSELKLSPIKLQSENTFPSKSSKAGSVLPISIGVLAAVYLLNPVIIYENKKIYAGITKEISIGWGKLGEHRTAFEYSIILGGNVRHLVRFSYKYDFLLTSGIEPSHMLQGTSVFSAGAGYFTDFKGTGVFPELTYGYSIRNHKYLFYPHIKLRHTFMFNKDKPDITDFSFGIILGIANPFIEVDIRRKY